MTAITLRLWQKLAISLLCAAATRGVAFGLGDIAAGSRVWLQGYDGWSTSPGFANDGVLRLETVDEPLDVGFSIDAPGVLTNRSDGLILIGAGAGGNRHLGGNLWNQGTLDIAAYFELSHGGQVVNDGTITVESGASLAVLGFGAEFDQSSGSLTIADKTANYPVFYADQCRFVYSGGLIDGPLTFARSTFVVGDAVTNGLSLAFEGDPCAYDGRFSRTRTLLVYNSGSFTNTSILFTNLTDIDGSLTVSATGGPVSVLFPVAGVVGAHGFLSVYAPTNECAVVGSLGNDGSISVHGSLAFRSQGGSDGVIVTNRGTMDLATGANLDVDGLLRIEGGRATMVAGRLGASRGVVITGGQFEAGGKVDAGVTNGGLLAADQSAPLVITRDFAQSASGELRINLASGGTNQAPSALVVSNNLTLGGKLTVNNTGGAALSEGSKVTLATAGTLAGSFTSVSLPSLSAGLNWADATTNGVVQFKVVRNASALAVALTVGAGTNVVNVIGPPASTLKVQTTTDLVSWSDLRTISPFNGSVSVSAPHTSGGKAFYRAVVEP
jgi:hypothetical protein